MESDRPSDGWMCKQWIISPYCRLQPVDGWMDGWIDRHIDGHRVRKTVRWMDVYTVNYALIPYLVLKSIRKRHLILKKNAIYLQKRHSWCNSYRRRDRQAADVAGRVGATSPDSSRVAMRESTCTLSARPTLHPRAPTATPQPDGRT
jgi:hypothetical protein